MRVLVLGPHPYYVDRGTPIDLDLVLRVLCARSEVSVDLIVYPDGLDRDYNGLTIHRIPRTPFTTGTRPGFSVKKLICDVLMFFRAWSLVRRRRFDLIHAGEEAVFLAMFFKRLYGIPFVYDLDSSIAQQLVEKLPLLRPLAPLLDALEAAAIRDAIATAPVCKALADLCLQRGARKVVTLHDISQLDDPDAPSTGQLRREAKTERLVMLYAGNLEAYQGVDLLIDAFAIAARETDQVDLVVIGGERADIARYEARAKRLGVAHRIRFLGPRPLQQLACYLTEADILVAPRIRGINTPMKIFPYLHSGRAVLVTDLPTHSQILTPQVAMLAAPEPVAFARAIVRLAADETLRAELGRRGRLFVETDHTFKAHERRMQDLYGWIEIQIAAQAG